VSFIVSSRAPIKPGQELYIDYGAAYNNLLRSLGPSSKRTTDPNRNVEKEESRDRYDRFRTS
jgi:hypothetical protein